jgi:hypothetical protein
MDKIRLDPGRLKTCPADCFTHPGETPTSCASACQCQGCGMRLPDRMSDEYGSLTQVLNVFEISGRSRALAALPC